MSRSRPELGRLDRDLAVDPGGDDLVDGLDVVVGDLVGLGQVLEVLAEPGVHRPDSGRLEREGRRERVGQRLARHEPADGPAHEPDPGQAFLQPSIPGGPQEEMTHECLLTAPSTGAEQMVGDHPARIAPHDPLLRHRRRECLLAELDGILGVLAEQRAELVRLRDEVLAAGSGGGEGAPTAVGGATAGPDGPPISTSCG